MSARPFASARQRSPRAARRDSVWVVVAFRAFLEDPRLMQRRPMPWPYVHQRRAGDAERSA